MKLFFSILSVQKCLWKETKLAEIALQKCVCCYKMCGIFMENFAYCYLINSCYKNASNKHIFSNSVTVNHEGFTRSNICNFVWSCVSAQSVFGKKVPAHDMFTIGTPCIFSWKLRNRKIWGIFETRDLKMQFWSYEDLKTSFFCQF